jgi:hypothetical protein
MAMVQEVRDTSSRFSESFLVPRGKRGRPLIRTTDDAMKLWAERLKIPACHASEPWCITRASIIVEGLRIYHYGHHFMLAEIATTPNWRPKHVFVNVDSYGGSGGWGPCTRTRQWQIWALVLDSGLRVVPFSFKQANTTNVTVLDATPEASLVRRVVVEYRYRRPNIHELEQHGRYLGALKARRSGIRDWPAMDAAIDAGSPIHGPGDRIRVPSHPWETILTLRSGEIHTFRGRNRPKTIESAIARLEI